MASPSADEPENDRLVRLLDPPFDGRVVLQKRIALRKALGAQPGPRLAKKIAILGGSTTDEVRHVLELFLLRAGIQPSFYESQFGRYWEEAVFGTPELDAFAPDVVYVHTGFRNLRGVPGLDAGEAEVVAALDAQMEHFEELWQTAERRFGCPVIQNNVELPDLRPLGHLDSSAVQGQTRYVLALNQRIAEAAARHGFLIVNDVFQLSARLGLERWHDPRFWHAYRYALAHDCIPELAHRVARLVAAVFGLSKKCLVVDLDDTLWGGVIGDVGLEGIEVGGETAEGEAFAALQSYLKALHQRGVLLAVCSKNERENALAGFDHPDSVLRVEDFAAFEANWEPKPASLEAIARTLSIGLDSLVFLDDNPAEREIVRAQLPQVTVPEIGRGPDGFLRVLDQAAYFESVALSEDDLARNRRYAENRARGEVRGRFASHDDFLASLAMQAEIAPFAPLYFDRIAQLVNKTNQFNLTTRRRSREELEGLAAAPGFVTLQGRLADKFGDNGLVTVLIAEAEGDTLRIDTWLMSCRVLGRGMERAMFEALLAEARRRGVSRIEGCYVPTSRNALVAGLYAELGFQPGPERADGSANGNTDWSLDVSEARPRPHAIRVVEGGQE